MSWRRFLLWWMLVLTTLLAAATASAAAGPPAKPHQGTAEFSAALSVWLHADATVEQRTGNPDANTAGASDVPHAARGAASRVLLRTTQQVQSKFKHAKAFGVVGNQSKKTLAEFSRAIHQHINAAGTRVIQGTYRGQAGTHFVDPKTGLNVFADPAGNLVSGWKLNPVQLTNVLTRGSL